MITKDNILVLDIECHSDYDINRQNEQYLETAKLKWIAFYSYKKDKKYVLPAKGNEALIAKFMDEHDVIVTFNGDAFDIPILKNSINNLYPSRYKKSIDVKEVLVGRAGRGYLMGYKFRKNSLKEVAKTMKVDTAKGDIDHSIWKKDDWTPEEVAMIKEYAGDDVMATKEIFDKIWDFWLPFTNFVTEKNVYNYSWITSSEGSLAYKYYCYTMGLQEEFDEKGGKTDGGGRVIEPRVEEDENVIYADVRSLYPHMYAKFNLFAEVSEGTPGAWHGNSVFKVRGYYDISEQHKFCADMMEKLKARIIMKEKDPDNPLAFTYKILLNSSYGANRSKVFKNMYTPNSGYDCCWLGRQVNEIMEKKMAEKGYDTIAGDTDSVFLKYRGELPPYDKIKADLDDVVKYICDNSPFPQRETFEIEIEAIIPYIAFVQDEEKTLKKNYFYIKKKMNGPNVVVIMGLPIKKVNRTELGWQVYKKHIEPRILAENKGKFDKIWIIEKIQEELKANVLLTAQEYNFKQYESYGFKGRNSLPAQISKAYGDGKAGRVLLIKNTKTGQVGGKFKYCSVEEAKKADLDISDLDLTKTYNELNPFCRDKLVFDGRKKPVQGFFNAANATPSGQGLKVEVKKSGFFS